MKGIAPHGQAFRWRDYVQDLMDNRIDDETVRLTPQRQTDQVEKAFAKAAVRCVYFLL